jgi:hypothetical protein
VDKKTVFQSTIIGSLIIGLSIVTGCYLISRAPRYEPLGELLLIETSTGTLYRRTGSVGTDSPNYLRVPGPESGQSQVTALYK